MANLQVGSAMVVQNLPKLSVFCEKETLQIREAVVRRLQGVSKANTLVRISN